MPTKKLLLPLTLCLMIGFLSACNNRATPTPTAEVTQPQLVETTLTVEPTESPTATPIVLLDAEILLWAPESADQALAAQLNNEVGSYANANGYSFAVTPTLSAP